MSQQFLITGGRVFDGEQIQDGYAVLVDGDKIVAAGPGVTAPDGATVIDSTGQTLLPGLIDAHAHAQPPALEHALTFGVTTELDMFSMPDWMGPQRVDAANRNDMADVRSASVGATVSGGHPSMLIGTFFPVPFPVIASASEAGDFVKTRVSEGADYIKLLIDDGKALGHEGPTLDEEMATAIAAAAHEAGLMAVAHATSLDGAMQAIRAGVDGLVHVFMDQEPNDEVVDAAAAAGIFVTPTLSTVGSLAGDIDGTQLSEDERTAGLITPEWRENLCQCWQLGSPGSVDHALAATLALHRAGVDILAGTDAAGIGVLGTAHGVSLHGELQLLVRAGLTNLEVLRATTSKPARRFGLMDRGRIAEGLQADLLLVDGDPSERIEDTLSIAGVWRRGERLDREARKA